MRDFVIISAFLSGVALLILYSKKIKEIHTVPNILTAMGVLGTFVGITISLYKFNPSDINNSIPELLYGMKFAFLTSIFGMSFSLLTRLKPTLYLNESNASDESDPVHSMAKNISELKDLERLKLEIEKRKIDDDNTRHRELCNILKSNNEKSNLELKKFEAQSINSLNNLNSSFESFARKVADNNSKALIEALSSVMRDFNDRINDQLGENFKNLNSSVTNLVTWQENHKTQMENLIQSTSIVASSLGASEKSMAEISKNGSVLIEIGDSMLRMNDLIKEQVLELGEGLSGIAHLGKQASNTFPNIKENLDLTIKSLTDSSQKLIEQSAQSLGTLRTELETFDRGVKESNQKSINNLNANMASHFEKLDSALGEELNKSLSALGNQLASLSGKFVEDYGYLASALEKIKEATIRSPINKRVDTDFPPIVN